MIDRPLSLRTEFHPLECDCSVCEALAPAPASRLTADQIALRVIGGFGAGIVLTKLLDVVTAGPGLSQMFGW